MVHQHFMLVDNFTVIENVMLGVEGGRLLAGGLARARAALEQIARDYGLAVPLDAVVEHLPVGLQQRVEILKALYRRAEILILDEPTAVLTPQETDQALSHARPAAPAGEDRDPRHPQAPRDHGRDRPRHGHAPGRDRARDRDA